VEEKTAFDLAEKGDYMVVDCPVPTYSGMMVSEGGRVAIVDEEFTGFRLLPKYITNESQAQTYLGQLGRAHFQGVQEGRMRLQSDLRVLLDLGAKKTAETVMDYHLQTFHKDQG
jgi:hypothetical protein